ncbi:NADH-quinone oxidoreductase subunit N [Asticcacaulis biprosthecium C19]|uniref:NADH-quinone oxidoreductase subunit N n=2 Tax=Asticcacaulis biprosthecium TaxID=76891 RepID=F4QQW4_9CAUL|nr:NADH-quinone oxidoreductase subunit N [Asticcacaulis biprosthecium C19]
MDLAMDFPAFNEALPETILGLSAILILVFGAFRGDKGMTSISALCGAALIGAAFAAAWSPLGTAFSGSFVSDGVSVFAKVAMYIASAFIIVLGQGYFDRLNNRRFEFPILILLATLGMSIMVSAGDLIALYVGLELQSLALYVLAAFRRDDAKSSEAGLKYFVLGALASGLLLYGASLVYGFAGSMYFTDIAAAANDNMNVGLIFGLVFVISGLAFKVSAAPFHMWTPDVYEGAPTPVVAFFAGAPKFAAMILLARVLETAFLTEIDQWRQVLLVLAVLSFAVGGLGGLMQKDFKRLLAYSSIANMGYALLAIAAGTTQGIQALLMFFALYMVDSLGLFAAQMSLQRKDGEPVTRIDQFAGLAKVNMPIAIAITILALSVLGMPPFGGFWSKYFVFGAALSSDLIWFAVAGLVASVIAAFYYLRLIKLMWFDAPVVEFGKAPLETRWIALASAAFSFPGAIVFLIFGSVLAAAAVVGFGAH